MKVEEIREMTEEELRQALEDNRQELFNLRFQLATRKTKNHQRIPIVKRDIARIMTVLRERDLMAQYAGADFSGLEQPALSGASGDSGKAKRSGLLSRVRRGGR
jgi:large subunit ribosomal protein L29